MSRTSRRLQLCWLLTALLSSLKLAAEPLRADVIVFLRPDSAALPAPIRASRPDDRRAIAMDDEQGLKLAGLNILPESEFGLAREWRQLRAAAGYEPLLKLAFTEENPPASGGAALRLFQPSGDGNGLNGFLRLLAGKNGGVELDLEYQLPKPPEGAAKAYRVQQKRSASKPDSMLYLDGGRLGALVKLSRPPATKAVLPAKP